MLWLPTRFLTRIKSDLGELVLVIYIYATSLVLSPIFANLDAVYPQFMGFGLAALTWASYDHLTIFSALEDPPIDIQENFLLWVDVDIDFYGYFYGLYSQEYTCKFL